MLNLVFFFGLTTMLHPSCFIFFCLSLTSGKLNAFAALYTTLWLEFEEKECDLGFVAIAVPSKPPYKAMFSSFLDPIIKNS